MLQLGVLPHPMVTIVVEVRPAVDGLPVRFLLASVIVSLGKTHPALPAGGGSTSCQVFLVYLHICVCVACMKINVVNCLNN